MDGLEAVEMRFADVPFENEVFRFDAEYFKKEPVDLLKKIRSQGHFKVVDEFGVSKLAGFEFTQFFTPANLESEDKYIALTSKNIQSEELVLSDYITIDKKTADANLDRSKLYKNDIVLSYTGEYRRALVLFDGNFQLGPNVCRLRPLTTPDLSFYLSTFFNSRIGQLILDREKTLSAQPTVSMSRIREIPIPLFDELVAPIKSAIVTAHKIHSKSHSLYKQAEIHLLKGLNLSVWQPPRDTFSVRTLKDSFISTGRLDAEYYQPKFDELESILRKTGKDIRLGSVLSMNRRGTQPEYTEDGGIRVLNSKHIRENLIEFGDNRMGNEKETHPHLIIRMNDVLINGTGVGTIGRTAPYLRDEPALPDNHVTILRTSGIDPVYLSVLLNSIVGKLQVEKYYKGSSGQIELYPEDINQFMIWDAPPEIQQEIRSKIEEGESLRNESKRLLESAKRAVEIAIEEGEDAALAFLSANQQIDQ